MVIFINCNDSCNKKTDDDGHKFACGQGCTGTPSCGGIVCGNVDDMCYCDCDDLYKCKTTDKGYKWNKGIKLANGSYALNGTKGDGKEYVCTKGCQKKTDVFGHKYDCGEGCTGTPSCGGLVCGKVDDMCYCDCNDMNPCKTTDKGNKWNKGIKLANGSYALNGTKGDGKEYKCS